MYGDKLLLIKGLAMWSKFKVVGFKNKTPILFVLGFGVVGVLALSLSKAATPSVSFESESSTVSAPAASISDATASGGGAVRFSSMSGQVGCPPIPSYPDENCTGWRHTGVTLKRVPQDITTAAQAGGANIGWNWTNGYLNIFSANAIIEGIEVDGVVYNNNDSGVNNYFPGVTIRNSHIRGTGAIDGWCVELGPGATVTDTEIGGGSNGSTWVGCIGILVGNYSKSVAQSTITRANIHDTEHGMRIDGNATVQDSYIHEFLMNDPSNHTDGIMITAGGNINIIHNRISHGNTSTFFVQWQTGNVNIGNMNIEDTYFEGIVDPTGTVSSYGVDIENKGITGKITVKNNVFTQQNTWGNRGNTAAAVLIPQAIGTSAMGVVCGNVYKGTLNPVRVEIYGGGIATQTACQ